MSARLVAGLTAGSMVAGTTGIMALKSADLKKPAGSAGLLAGMGSVTASAVLAAAGIGVALHGAKTPAGAAVAAIGLTAAMSGSMLLGHAATE